MFNHDHLMNLRQPGTSIFADRARPVLARHRPILIFLSFALLLGAPAVRVAARPTSAPEARQAAETWLSQEDRPLGARLSKTLDKVEAFNAGTSETVYYVASLAPEGFIVIAGEDLVEPIIAFSATGHSNAKTPNPMRSLVHHDISKRVRLARQHQKKPLAKGEHFAPAEHEARARAKWGRMIQAAVAAGAPTAAAPHTASVSDLRVAPLVQSHWDQETIVQPDPKTGIYYDTGLSCYNYYTPKGSAGAASNYPCGCVATAMAQIMRYYSYPTAGVGALRFSITYDAPAYPKQPTYYSRALRGGDGQGGAYAWGSMPLVPSNTTTLAQRQAIGALTYDAGVAVMMDYESDAKGGSGAYVSDAATQLNAVFKYSNTIDYYGGTDAAPALTIPPTILGKMIDPNLDAGFPVLLGIYDNEINPNNSVGGHAIVCDGYGFNSTTPYHHLNMGWSGYDDAWYNLPTIDADATMSFNSVYELVYNIYPTGYGEIISGRIFNDKGLPVQGAVVTATRSGGGTYTSKPTNALGVYAVAKIPSNSQYTVSVAKLGLVFTAKTAATGKSANDSATPGNVWGLNFSASGRTAVKGWESYE